MLFPLSIQSLLIESSCSYYKQGDVPPPPKKKANKKMAALKAALMLKAMFGTGKEAVDAAAPGEAEAAERESKLIEKLTAEAEAADAASQAIEAQVALEKNECPDTTTAEIDLEEPIR